LSLKGGRLLNNALNKLGAIAFPTMRRSNVQPGEPGGQFWPRVHILGNKHSRPAKLVSEQADDDGGNFVMAAATTQSECTALECFIWLEETPLGEMPIGQLGYKLFVVCEILDPHRPLNAA